MRATRRNCFFLLLNIPPNACMRASSPPPHILTSHTKILFLGADDGEEHVERDLNAVDKDEAMLRRDELEVDGVNDRPHLPRSLARREEVRLDLVDNGRHAVAVHESEVREEYRHEDGAPEELIDGDLAGDGGGAGALDLGVEPVVEVVAGGAVVDEAEDGEGDEALHVEGAARDEDLRQQIAEGPPHETRARLGGERILIEALVVRLPSGDGPSPRLGRVAEERTDRGRVLSEGSTLGGGEGGLGGGGEGLVDRGGDAEGRCGEARGGDEEGGELDHGVGIDWM
mmetsp:Transcript_59860/g.177415  ORF Transcript_59860/g.177415 Transcript_59860/m.177415 type:complete len:285 (-) Transcript_59860:134-988(-)